MTTSTQSTVLQVMQDRKSVRIYDDSHTISNEVLTKLLSDATTAPSSSNLQPWRFIVFNNKASQQELRTIAYN
ncbi:Putative NAD(P)H nitroreductase YodC [Metalysinibacillus saudimassiliensis]|uniref:Putative NAD(P)H nitroreductase YodC n=2 Tax=Bacillales TaxID=1385 RepID=A0A078M264_9BACL|nr:Putative NAD(P)H nitroreductase YodC [Metalysinibacillus saudimassiliensis]